MSVRSCESAACSVVCPVWVRDACAPCVRSTCTRANQSLSTPTGRKSSSFITMLKALGLGEAADELDRRTRDLRYSICTN